MVAQSYKWMQKVIAGEAVLLRILPRLRALIRQTSAGFFPFACLSPDIVEAILQAVNPQTSPSSA